MNLFTEHGSWSSAVGFGALGGTLLTGFAIITLVIILWEIFWKGLAFWHSARNNQKGWFVVFLLVHTLGILEIIYLFGFRTDRVTTSLFPHSKAPSTPTPSSPVA